MKQTIAKVTVPFRGARDGQIYPEELKAGDMIEGDLARAAIEMGTAKETEPAAPAKTTSKDKLPNVGNLSRREGK